MIAINEEILNIKNKLDKLLLSFNHPIEFDDNVYNVLKETKVRLKYLFIEAVTIKCKNSIQEIKNPEIEEQINIFLEIYEIIEMNLEKILLNYNYDCIMSSDKVKNINEDLNTIENLIDKVQEELVKTNSVIDDMEKTFSHNNEIVIVNFKNYITKKELLDLKNEIKQHLEGISDKMKLYEIKKVNFS